MTRLSGIRPVRAVMLVASAVAVVLNGLVISAALDAPARAATSTTVTAALSTDAPIGILPGQPFTFRVTIVNAGTTATTVSWDFGGGWTITGIAGSVCGLPLQTLGPSEHCSALEIPPAASATAVLNAVAGPGPCGGTSSLHGLAGVGTPQPSDYESNFVTVQCASQSGAANGTYTGSALTLHAAAAIANATLAVPGGGALPSGTSITLQAPSAQAVGGIQSALSLRHLVYLGSFSAAWSPSAVATTPLALTVSSPLIGPGDTVLRLLTGDGASMLGTTPASIVIGSVTISFVDDPVFIVAAPIDAPTVCSGGVQQPSLRHVVVPAGSVCSLNGGTVADDIDVHGGSLVLTSTHVGGDLRVDGGSIVVDGATLSGNVDVHHLSTAPPGGGAIRFCATTVGGNLDLHDNRAPLVVGNGQDCTADSIGGHLDAHGNKLTGAGPVVTIVGDVVAKGMNVHDNEVDGDGPAAVVGANRVLDGDLDISDNRSAIGGGPSAVVSGNTTVGHLTCHADRPAASSTGNLAGGTAASC